MFKLALNTHPTPIQKVLSHNCLNVYSVIVSNIYHSTRVYVYTV